MRPFDPDNLKTISKVLNGDPVADFQTLLASDHFTLLANRALLPETLEDIDGQLLKPEDFRARAENFESIYEDTNLIELAHRDVIASD